MRGRRLDLASSLRRAALALALVFLCGCHKGPASDLQDHEAGSMPSDSWRADDARFSDQDRAAIAAARRYLEERRHKPVDGFFRVRRTPGGCEVRVTFVAGYDNGRPLSYPGGQCTVLFAADGTVTQAVPGP